MTALPINVSRAEAQKPTMRTASGADAARRLTVSVAVVMFLCMPIETIAQSSMTRAYLDRFEAQKTSVVLPDGQRLAYLELGTRDAPALVLIHGYTDSARDWAPLAPLLTPKFRLLIVDLRGHGASAKPDCCYTRFDFAYDIKLLLDALHIATADIAGHSLGSIVAQTFAELWPGSTRHLVLISSTGTSFGTTEPGGSPGSAKALAPSWLIDLAQLKDPIDADSAFMRDWWRESMRINPEFFVSRQRHDAAAIPARVWRAIADQSLTGVDLRSMLPRVQAPSLLIWGARDTLVGDAGRDALRAGLARVEVRTFGSLGHDLFWEDPRAVAGVISEFLAKK